MQNKVVNTIINKVKDNLPTILFVTGIVGFGVGTVEACKSTLKLEPIIEEHKETIDEIHAAAEKGTITDKATSTEVEFTDKDRKQALVRCYGNTALQLGKLYWKPLLIDGISVALLTKSHVDQKNKISGLGVALTSNMAMFERYRNYIREKYGDVVDNEARFGVTSKKVKGKNGEPGTVEYTATDKTFANSDITFYYDETYPNWSKDIKYNLMMIKQAELDMDRKMYNSFDGKISVAECMTILGNRIKRKPLIQMSRVLGYNYIPGETPINPETGFPDKAKINAIVVNRATGKSESIPIAEAYKNCEELFDSPSILLEFVGLERI